VKWGANICTDAASRERAREELDALILPDRNRSCAPAEFVHTFVDDLSKGD
jgi:hypothetical protein